MEKNEIENTIVKLILPLNLQMIEFVEEKFCKLSPAGQYQICILTAAMIIESLKDNKKINAKNIKIIAIML